VLYFFDPQFNNKGVTRTHFAFTVIFASSDVRNLGALKNSSYETLVMPVWSREELIHCRKLLFGYRTWSGYHLPFCRYW